MDLSSLPLQQFSRAELLALAHRLLDYLSRIPPGPDESTALLGVEGHASAGQKGIASGVATKSYALQASQHWPDWQRGQKAVPANACDDMNESAPVTLSWVVSPPRRLEVDTCLAMMSLRTGVWRKRTRSIIAMKSVIRNKFGHKNQVLLSGHYPPLFPTSCSTT